jgi:hypothetical protein
MHHTDFGNVSAAVLRSARRLCAIVVLSVVVAAAGMNAPTAVAVPPEKAGIDLPPDVLIKAMSGGAVPTESQLPALPKFEDVTKDMQSAKGLFTLWYYPAEAKEKDREKLLCQIPAAFLGEKFMLSTSFSGGGFFTGFPLDERVVQWELLDRQVLLIEPETRFVVDKQQTVSDVVRRTYPERIRAALPLVTKSPSGDPVVDLGGLLKSDFADIAWMTSFLPRTIPSVGINASLSKWTKKKAFDLNVEIGVELAVNRPSPPGSYDKKLVHYSFWKLPPSDYTPRIADDRVGYFLTANRDWAKPTDARDIFNRYIDRWYLVKRDPQLSVCEPRQPITFYIEKTVPIRFRRAVRDGILEWNKAYEKIGFASAIEVRQQTDDNEWKDLDPEDMRYSFFRWIVTGAGFAMGPHRANPFTGQIYDADIIFDDSMVRYFEQQAQQMLPSALVDLKLRDPALREFFQRFPQWQRPQREWESFSFGEDQDPRLLDAMLSRMRLRGQHCCDYADGMKHQLALGHSFLIDQPKDVIDRFLYDTVKEVVMHEVGHTLGLRHNFKASSIWSIPEIRQRRADGLATTGSVMDYNPVLFFKDKALDGNFLTPTIGPYDYWAIEYGYRPADGSFGRDEKPRPDAKEEKQREEKPRKDGAEKTAEAPPPAQQIPKEVLEKLSPEVRKMVESGAAAKMIVSEGGPAKPAAGPVFPGASASEKEMLQRIASRCAEPELAYATDEDTTILGPDPRANRFDMGSDPIEWAETRVTLINQRMENILDWAVRDQESWYFLRQAFLRLLIEKAFVLDYVGRYIGGQHTSRSHRGDPNAPEPFQVVDAKTQRDALAFTEKYLFTDKYFAVDTKVLNHLAAPRWWHAGAFVSFTVDFPYYETVGMLQWWNLFDRFFPNTLRRIQDAELKCASADKFTASEYLQRLSKACWADSLNVERAQQGEWTDEAPFVSGLRRSLQRQFLDVVEPLVRTPPGWVLTPDLHAMVQQSVRELRDGIQNVQETGKLDFASKSHLAACDSRIGRMLAPRLDEYNPRGGAAMTGMEGR